MDSNLVKDDKEIIAFLGDVTYFNFEISPCLSTFVVNASRKGIDAFLSVYGQLETPPAVLSCSPWKNTAYLWKSWRLQEIWHVLPTPPFTFIEESKEVLEARHAADQKIVDEQNKALEKERITPYRADINTHTYNGSVNHVRIRYLDQDDAKPVLCAGMKDDIPILTLNKKGWKQFLQLLVHLRDRSYWFYVTPLNPPWRHLPFQLTVPYRGDIQDHIFKAIEWIRVEPSDEIYFNWSDDCIHANNTGWLLFAHWMRRFANGSDEAQDICNRWNVLPSSLNWSDTFASPPAPPNWIYLRKMSFISADPIFYFAKREVTREFFEIFIFANNEGFETLAQTGFYYTLLQDYDPFAFRSSQKKPRGGHPMECEWCPKGFISTKCAVVGGGYHTPKYNPPRNSKAHKPSEEIEKQFVNDRILQCP